MVRWLELGDVLRWEDDQMDPLDSDCARRSSSCPQASPRLGSMDLLPPTMDLASQPAVGQVTLSEV